jgi:hypothetical protein
MSTPMIDFDHFDITAIVRQRSPFALNRTTVFFDGDRESMFFICTEEEHEKLVADYLAWKDVKTARKSYIQQKIEFDRCRNEHLKKILAPAFNRIWSDIEEQYAKEKDDLATKMARDYGFAEPKQTPPMPKAFNPANLTQSLTQGVKIEEIEDALPIIDFKRVNDFSLIYSSPSHPNKLKQNSNHIMKFEVDGKPFELNLLEVRGVTISDLELDYCKKYSALYGQNINLSSRIMNSIFQKIISEIIELRCRTLVKIEEIEETAPIANATTKITLSFGRSNIDVHVSELVYGDVDKVAKRISDSYKENYHENLSVSDVKQEIRHALLDSVFWRDTKK